MYGRPNDNKRAGIVILEQTVATPFTPKGWKVEVTPPKGEPVHVTQPWPTIAEATTAAEQWLKATHPEYHL